MDAHLLTTAIFSPESLDESDDSSSGISLREGTRKERYSLLNDILYFLKETMNLEEALKFSSDLEDVGFENAEGVVKRLLRLAVAMKQNEEKAKRDQNPDIDTFIKKTLKKIYKDHTTAKNKKEHNPEAGENKVKDPREEIPGSNHFEFIKKDTNLKEGLEDWEAEGSDDWYEDFNCEWEEEEVDPEDKKWLHDHFSFDEKVNDDQQWLVEAVNKMFDEDTETPKRLARVRKLRESYMGELAIEKMEQEEAEQEEMDPEDKKWLQYHNSFDEATENDENSKEDEDGTDPEDKKWLKYHSSFDESTNNDYSVEAVSIAKNLIDEMGVGEFEEEWDTLISSLRDELEPHSYSYNELEDILDIAADQMEEQPVDFDPYEYDAQYRKEVAGSDDWDDLEELGREDMPGRNYGTYKDAVDEEDEIDWEEELGREDMPSPGYFQESTIEWDDVPPKLQKKIAKLENEMGRGEYSAADKKLIKADIKTWLEPYTKTTSRKVKESYLDGDMSGPSDMKASSSNEEEKTSGDEAVLQAAAEVLKDKPQSVQTFLSSLNGEKK